MVVVYVWDNTPGDVGHVSLQVKDTYISFWPKNAAKAKTDIKLGHGHEAGFSSSYRIDRRIENRDPGHTISITKLNEDEMIAYWLAFKQKPDQYNMLKSNCSTVVASLLELGSGIVPNHSPSIKINEYVSSPYLKWMLKLRFRGNYIHMWTPNDVMIYALQIKSNLNA